MSDMDRECKNCGEPYDAHDKSDIILRCPDENNEMWADTVFEDMPHERVPVGFVDAVRELVKAVWDDADGGSIRLDKALQSIESMLSDMDKKEEARNEKADG